MRAAQLTGLAQYISPEELTGRLVCVAANLKPAKLAGEPSEAMVLAAEATAASGQVIVRTLLPPGQHGRLASQVLHPSQGFCGAVALRVGSQEGCF